MLLLLDVAALGSTAVELPDPTPHHQRADATAVHQLCACGNLHIVFDLLKLAGSQ
jgi:hypothetical protein